MPADENDGVQPQEEFNDSDYEDKYPDDLPSDKELAKMISGDATTFGFTSTILVLLIGLALYAYAKYM